jgi:hypothetical protein
MKMRFLRLPLAASFVLTTALTTHLAPAFGQVTDPATTNAPVTRPMTYALISAVGDRFTYVSQKQATGSNVLDNFTRKIVKIPNNALNASVLRGLDAALAKSDPASVRIFMSLEAAELDDVLPQNREAIALGKIVSAIEKMPQRKDWDKIIVVTPKYMQSEYSGMGSKLSGLGVYVQPLYSSILSGVNTDSTVGSELNNASDTKSPDGKRTRSERYVAPFSYTQTWTLDAKTLAVIDKSARHDFTKLFDEKSTALDVWKSIPDDVLAERILTLAERSAARALGVDLGAVVEIGDVTAIDPKTGAALKPAAPKK